MNQNRILLTVLTLVVLALSAGLLGCSKGTTHLLVPNERPTVTLTAAPVTVTDTAFYAYQMNWSGYDPDGRIDHYTYTVDPPTVAGRDTVWTSTTNNQQLVLFRSTTPVLGGPRSKAIDPHKFVIKAWDNSGAPSAPVSRSFLSYTICPVVRIDAPVPSSFLIRHVTPSMTVSWEGQDPDGVFTQKPVQYKYILLPAGNPYFDINQLTQSTDGPDSLRRLFAKDNFAEWDSVAGDTTSVQFTNLTPGLQYAFCLIGYDEDGAYSPDFSLVSNILNLTVNGASSNGPGLTVFNQFMFFDVKTGSFNPTNPTTWANVEIPASQAVTFNWVPSAEWVANVGAGVSIAWYRWRIDGDVDDETPRTNEQTDWYHWSQQSVGTTSCTIGPFSQSVDHKLYIEAQDTNGLVSVVTVHFTPVVPTFQNQLLVVDDTRADPDNVGGPNGVALYSQNSAWPSRAELDTFLFARGNVPWRGTQATGYQPYSKPGILAGYPFDTIGTRLGFAIMTNGIPFSLLGQYKHVMWMVDRNSALDTGLGSDQRSPQCALFYMNTPGNPNTLSTYAYAGGQVWMLGGVAALVSLEKFDASGALDNDKRYGPGKTVFDNASGELIPGRIMYDGAHWQDEMVYQKGSVSFIKSMGTNKAAWSQPGYKYSNQVGMTPADYATLPATLRFHSLATGDSLPPTRTSSQSSTYYAPGTLDLEYLSQPNWIIEDVDPSPLVDNEQPTLDTLYALKGGTIVTGQALEAASMTWYHGPSSPSFVFTGFPLWDISKQDLIPVVDFVLQKIWGLQRDATVQRLPQVAAHPTGAATAAAHAAAARATQARIPTARSGTR